MGDDIGSGKMATSVIKSGAATHGAATHGAASAGAEIANAVTHGVGVLLSVASLVAMVLMAAMRGDVWHIASYAVFGVSLVILYTMSTLYHSLSGTKVVGLLQVLDHSSIFILIAGTYTAFCLTALRESSGWLLFGLEWGIAAVGIVCKALFLERWKRLSLVLYLVMGWLIVIAANDLGATLNPTALWALAAGGAFYTVGAFFYAAKKPSWTHPVWHLFVIAGSACHVVSVVTALP